MSIGISLSRLLGCAGLLILPLAASAQNRACWLRDAVAPTATTVYAMCEQGRLYVTNDAGKTWTTRETGAVVKLNALTFLDASRGIAVGDGSTIMTTADGGKTWQKRPTEFTDHLLSIVFSGNNVWTGGYNGLLLYSPDGGATWQKQATPSGLAIEGLYFLDASHGWAVGWAGTILRTADGGKTWIQTKSDAASWSLTSVYFKDLQNGWIAGFSGQLLRTRDGGATWTALKVVDEKGEPLKSWLKGIAFDRSNRGWVTTDEQFLFSADGGETWKLMPETDELLFLRDFARVGDSLWALGQLGILQQSGVGTDWKPVESLVIGGSTRDVIGSGSGDKPTTPQ